MCRQNYIRRVLISQTGCLTLKRLLIKLIVMENATGIRATPRSVGIFPFLAVAGLALLLRWPHLYQSLWYDEMYTFLDYVIQPWHRVLAAGGGEYVPNNHALYTILAKLVYMTQPQSLPPSEAALRLPALLAGCVLPVALVWTFQSHRMLAWIVASIACFHPWLVAFSTEARGYSLLLLLGVTATNLLPTERRRWSIHYALTIAAAIYTVPIALLLLCAHGIVMMFLRRSAITNWLRSSAIALAIVAALYFPMRAGLISYYRQPFKTTITYREFLDQLPRFAMAGDNLAGSAIYWALPVLVMILGSVVAWNRPSLRPLLLTMAIVSILGMILPLISPAATEVRFVPWIGIWFTLAVAAILTSPTVNGLKWISGVGTAILLLSMGVRDYRTPPNQPIREAMHQIGQLAPPSEAIMTTYLGAREAALLYGEEAPGHPILPAPDLLTLLQVEDQSIQQTGQKPWVIIFYEQLALRRNFTDPDARGLWTHLMKNYQLVRRLPGRVSPVAIYQPRSPDNVAYSN